MEKKLRAKKEIHSSSPPRINHVVASSIGPCSGDFSSFHFLISIVTFKFCVINFLLRTFSIGCERGRNGCVKRIKSVNKGTCVGGDCARWSVYIYIYIYECGKLNDKEEFGRQKTP